MYDENGNSQAKSLKDVIDKLIQLHGWSDKLDFIKIIENWESFVGQAIANHTKPKKLQEGILHIATDSSVWRAELLLRQTEIIELINKHLNNNAIRTLKIR